jgi:hypothetical protein
MAINHSEQTHRNLVDRVPDATGRSLPEWFQAIEDGPPFLRFDERVSWLRGEFELPHGYATAIVHEHDLQRAHRSFS